ncbi:MAG: hypothetical protein V6Z81_10310 [Parvularculales bacterium]
MMDNENNSSNQNSENSKVKQRSFSCNDSDWKLIGEIANDYNMSKSKLLVAAAKHIVADPEEGNSSTDQLSEEILQRVKNIENNVGVIESKVNKVQNWTFLVGYWSYCILLLVDFRAWKERPELSISNLKKLADKHVREFFLGEFKEGPDPELEPNSAPKEQEADLRGKRENTAYQHSRNNQAGE